MSIFMPSDFTRQASDTKAKLDEFFCIVAKEEAMRIIQEMRGILNSGKKLTKISDYQEELLAIMETIPQYIENHYTENADGERRAKALIFKFSSRYADEIENALDKYEEYADELRNLEEINRTIDAEFMDKLNEIHGEYKSSTDHMTRLVRRLLKYNFEVPEEDIAGERTRVLILKQFIKQFGYDCKGIRCEELKAVVAEKYNGDVGKIDDSIFDLISQPQETKSDNNEGVLFSDEYIGALTRLHDTIRINAPMIYVTKKICKKLCEVMCDWVLSDKAKAGTAVRLSDCFVSFVPYYEIGMRHIKNYDSLESTEELTELNKMLRDRFATGYYLYTDFSHSLRLHTLLRSFGGKIRVLKKDSTVGLIRELYPEAFLDISFESKTKYKLSSFFDPDKINFVDFEDHTKKKNYVKLVKSLENALFETAESTEQKKALKVKYAVLIGKEHDEQSQKNIGKQITYADYPDIYRLMVLAKHYADIIPVTSEKIAWLKGVYPSVKIGWNPTAKRFSDVLNNGIVNKIMGATGAVLADDNSELKKFINYAEDFVKDKEEYTAKLYERVCNRYKNASKAGKGDKGKTDFDSNRKELYAAHSRKFNDYSLLKIADSLANAKFSSQGKTREYLYIFAVAFDIRRVKGENNPLRICDIEKPLFWDYYADNIVNNLTSVAGLGEGEDVSVDGHGINYKNFAEIIFLWCLNQPDLTARERLEKVYDIIEYCKENGKTKDEFKRDDKKTQDYMTRQFENDFKKAMSYSEDRFKRYVIKNYPCKSYNSGIMQMNDEQRTAAKVISKQTEVVNGLLDKVLRVRVLSDVTDSTLEDSLTDNQKDFFYEYHYLTSKRCRNCPKHSTVKFPYCKEYYEPFEVTEKVDKCITTKAFENCRECFEYFGQTTNEIEQLKAKFLRVGGKQFATPEERFEATFSKVKGLCTEKHAPLKLLLDRIQKRIAVKTGNGIRFKDISRSTVMAACFYQFVLINWLKRSGDEDTCYGNFEKFYNIFVNGDVFKIDLFYTDENDFDYDDDFEITEPEKITYEGANKILEEAGYAPVNTKNIFDVYLIYIAYRDNFLPLYTDPIDGFVDKYKKLYNDFKEIERKIGEK